MLYLSKVIRPVKELYQNEQDVFSLSKAKDINEKIIEAVKIHQNKTTVEISIEYPIEVNWIMDLVSFYEHEDYRVTIDNSEVNKLKLEISWPKI